MKILHRSISNYQKTQKPNVGLPRRQISVPCTLYQQYVCDEVDGVSTQLPSTVLECIEDAAGLFSKVCATLVHSPGSVDPDYTPEHFHSVLLDAEQLLPNISHLVTDNQPDGLSVVRDILTRMQEENPNLEHEYLAGALQAVKNAIRILHLNDNDNIDVNTLITQPRDFIAAAMIVDKYLNNLSSDGRQTY